MRQAVLTPVHDLADLLPFFSSISLPVNLSLSQCFWYLWSLYFYIRHVFLSLGSLPTPQSVAQMGGVGSKGRISGISREIQLPRVAPRIRRLTKLIRRAAAYLLDTRPMSLNDIKTKYLLFWELGDSGVVPPNPKTTLSSANAH